MSGWIVTDKAAEQMRDSIREAMGEEAAALFELLVDLHATPVTAAAVQWGLVTGGAAWRPVAFGPWVVQPNPNPDHPLPTPKENPTP